MMERHRNVLSAGTMKGDEVINAAGEDLGEIEEVMIDVDSGRVAYAVLSFGGFLGMGEKLFAIPWAALHLDQERESFQLNVDAETLEDAPGFDEDDWPEFADETWAKDIHDYYGYKPYWSTGPEAEAPSAGRADRPKGTGGRERKSR